MPTQSNVDLVLVYLGEKMPKYVIHNLKYLIENFPNHRIFFVGDSERTLSRARKLPIGVFKTSNWREIKWEAYTKLEHPLEFRSGFWFNTIARFFALAEFQAVSSRPLIQIECDVFVAGNFPFSAFEDFNDSIAFPLENLKQGAASILWIGNAKLSQKLAEISLNLINADPRLTDMTILGRVANESLISFVSLPTIQSKECIDEPKALEVFSKNFVNFNGCFDALSYGMYLLGSDPRNRKGISELFKRRPEQVLPKDLISFNATKGGTSIEVKLKSGATYQLFCLHNHSKNIKLWKSSGYRLINKKSKLMQKRRDIAYVFYPISSLGLLYSKMKRFLRMGSK